MSRTVRRVWPEETLRVQDIVDLRGLQWHKQAACRGTDPEMWFSADSILDRAALELICAPCPVFTECLNSAISRDERGFWAGTTRVDRHEIVAEETGLPTKYRRYPPKK